MIIFFGADHAGFALKKELIPFVTKLGYKTEDCGAFSFDENDDYPDFILPVARKVSNNPEDTRGIVLGGSGQGEAIAANRFPRVRAIVFNGQYEPKDGRTVPHEIEVSREHNNANILSLGARFLSVEEAKDAVKRWLTTPFQGAERHVRRLKKIDTIITTM
jgi:ribose 5-phosphate isomerase B